MKAGRYRSPSQGSTREPLDLDYLGARGEAAVAQFFEIDWKPRVINESGWQKARATLHDLPGKIEVRASSRSNGGLIIRDWDKADASYVLVREVSEATIRIIGWMDGSTARNLARQNPSKYRKDFNNVGKEMTCIPGEDLYDVLELKMRLFGVPSYAVD